MIHIQKVGVLINDKKAIKRDLICDMIVFIILKCRMPSEMRSITETEIHNS